MIIAFDGNVFAGKTTLIKSLADRIACRCLAEQTFFIDQIKKGKKYQSAFKRHLEYLQVDGLRIKMMGRGLNLLDRSFVSLSAHVYALFYSSGVDLRARHLKVLRWLLNKKKIIIPDLYVFVPCSRKTALTRFTAERRHGGRGTAEMFIEKKYFSAVEKFNLLWQKGLTEGGVKYPGTSRRLEEIICVSAKKKPKKLSPREIIDLTQNILLTIK